MLGGAREEAGRDARRNLGGGGEGCYEEPGRRRGGMLGGAWEEAGRDARRSQGGGGEEPGREPWRSL